MTEQISNKSDEISLKGFIQKIGEWWSYLKSKWLIICFTSIIGGGVGVSYAWLHPITYTAKITFVVDDAKSGAAGFGGLASLAGQFGVDVGSTSGGGLLSGDNILLYFRSRSLVREVLLSKFNSNSDISVADIYVGKYNLSKRWKELTPSSEISFPILTETTKYTRLQDSLLQKIIDQILIDQLSVSKTDKKAGFIDVSATMISEDLAKVFCETIIKAAIDNYINVKTHRQQNTVDKLQKRVDSISSLLSRKTISGASLQTSASTMDINPLYKTGTAVAVETTIRDKTILSTLFSSVIQSLEMAKFTLSQETPIIQIVDSSRLPLVRNKLSRLRYGLLFASLLGFLSIIVFIVGLEFKKINR